MDIMKRISNFIETRFEALSRQKEKGKKIVGIVGPGYTPEELIHAAGAIPQRLMRAGDAKAIDDSREYCHNCFSTFHKAQIGYLMKGRDPVYSLPDHLVFESSDEHTELAGMYVYPLKQTPTTWLGVPGNPDFADAFPYYLTALKKLAAELESLTGNSISNDKLIEYIGVYNEIRELLREIGDLRTAPSPPITGLDFIKLSHGSFFCDPHEYVELLRTALSEFKKKVSGAEPNQQRITLFGCPVGVGDYDILALLESSGAIVVAEELSGSTRSTDILTETTGDPLEGLAKRYFAKRRRDVYCYPWGETLPAVFTNLAEKFKADGVIWYQLMYMACHGMFGYTLEKRFREMGMPFMTIHSEYDFESRGEAVRTRVETFVEMIKG